MPVLLIEKGFQANYIHLVGVTTTIGYFIISVLFTELTSTFLQGNVPKIVVLFQSSNQFEALLFALTRTVEIKSGSSLYKHQYYGSWISYGSVKCS